MYKADTVVELIVTLGPMKIPVNAFPVVTGVV